MCRGERKWEEPFVPLNTQVVDQVNAFASYSFILFRLPWTFYVLAPCPTCHIDSSITSSVYAGRDGLCDQEHCHVNPFSLCFFEIISTHNSVNRRAMMMSDIENFSFRSVSCEVQFQLFTRRKCVTQQSSVRMEQHLDNMWCGGRVCIHSWLRSSQTNNYIRFLCCSRAERTVLQQVVNAWKLSTCIHSISIVLSESISCSSLKPPTEMRICQLGKSVFAFTATAVVIWLFYGLAHDSWTELMVNVMSAAP